MEMQRKSLRTGAVVIGCAVLLRLFGSGFPGAVAQFLSQPEVASMILFLETGRVVRSPQLPDTTLPPETIPPETVSDDTDPTQPEEEPAQTVFSPADASLVALHNYCGYEVDVAALLQEPLSWDLTGDGPTVLILHTHATESYTNTENYTESSDYRTLDQQYNMISVGERLAQLLENAGIEVIHDRTLHDQPSYSGSYEQSRQTVQAYLEKYPTIRLVLDLHRDAITDSSGGQVGYALQTDKGTAAKMMLVMGSDAGGLHYPDWQDNLSLAVKLQAQLEKNQPGICRPLSFRSSRFNQDLCPGAVLVEMGAAGNTRQEALLSAEILAEAILDLAHGTTEIDN